MALDMRFISTCCRRCGSDTSKQERSVRYASSPSISYAKSTPFSPAAALSTSNTVSSTGNTLHERSSMRSLEACAERVSSADTGDDNAHSDASEVEDVVDEGEEGAAGAEDHRAVLTLLVRELRVDEEARGADDAV